MSSPQLDEEGIFHIARRINDAALRSEFLDQICGDDLKLRTRVAALLGVHEREQVFLKSAADPGATVGPSAISEGPGQRIGPYVYGKWCAGSWIGS